MIQRKGQSVRSKITKQEDAKCLTKTQKPFLRLDDMETVQLGYYSIKLYL